MEDDENGISAEDDGAKGCSTAHVHTARWISCDSTMPINARAKSCNMQMTVVWSSYTDVTPFSHIGWRQIRTFPCLFDCKRAISVISRQHFASHNIRSFGDNDSNSRPSHLTSQAIAGGGQCANVARRTWTINWSRIEWIFVNEKRRAQRMHTNRNVCSMNRKMKRKEKTQNDAVHWTMEAFQYYHIHRVYSLNSVVHRKHNFWVWTLDK